MNNCLPQHNLYKYVNGYFESISSYAVARGIIAEQVQIVSNVRLDQWHVLAATRTYAGTGYRYNTH
jgi:hypothetical protein